MDIYGKYEDLHEDRFENIPKSYNPSLLKFHMIIKT